MPAGCNGPAAIIIGREASVLSNNNLNKIVKDSPMNADGDGNETRSSGRKLRHLCYMKRPQTTVKKKKRERERKKVRLKLVCVSVKGNAALLLGKNDKFAG